MSPGDLVTATLILSGAVWVLYRSFWRSKGCCGGCDSAPCRPRPPDGGGLVRLAAPRRGAAPGGAPRAEG